MIDTEMFDLVTKSLGGRFPREKMTQKVKTAYSEIASRAEDLITSARRALPNLPRIHFDFIHNAEINAVAFRQDEHYFIGFHTGTVFMLRMVLGRMLSDSRVFPEVGNPDEETIDLPPIRNYSTNADVMAAEVVPLTPRNANRAAYASFLQDQAIMFFVGHELTHIVHGHVDYLQSKRNQHRTAEIEFEGVANDEERIERQTIEMDADRRSIFSRIDSLRITMLEPNFKLPWSSTAENFSRLIFDWSVSVNILFRMFGDIRFTLAGFNSSTYPPLPLRRAMCHAASLGCIQQRWDPALVATAAKALSQAQLSTATAFATILGTSNSEIENLSQSALRNHALHLEEYWNTRLLDKLKPFSYAPWGYKF